MFCIFSHTHSSIKVVSQLCSINCPYSIKLCEFSVSTIFKIILKLDALDTCGFFVTLCGYYFTLLNVSDKTLLKRKYADFFLRDYMCGSMPTFILMTCLMNHPNDQFKLKVILDRSNSFDLAHNRFK